MKHTLLFLIASAFCIKGASAQDSPITWGEQSKAGGAMSSYLPLGYNQGHYYSIQLANRAGMLVNVDSKMNIESQTPLITDQKKFDADFVFPYGGMINTISSEYSKDNNANNVYATDYSFDGRPAGPSEKMIFSVSMDRKSESTDFKYYFSSDSSVLLILERPNLKNNDMAQISFSVVNTKDYSKLWDATVTMPYKDEFFNLLSATVQNNGDLIVMASIKGEEGKRLERFSTHLFLFTGKSKKFVEKEMKIEGKFISSSRIQFLNNNKMMVTGFYNDLNDKGKSQGIEGAFIGLASADKMDALEIKTKALDEKTKLAVTQTGAIASLLNKDEMNAYSIEVMNVNNDGSGYVIAEQRFIVQRTDQYHNTIRYYYFNHLVLYRFDLSQEIQWISTIPKKQMTQITGARFGIGLLGIVSFPAYLTREAYKYNSFVSTEKDGKIYLLYNDNKDNGDARTEDDTKLMNNKNKALATLVTVDYNGKWKKNQLFRGKDLNAILDPSSCYVDPGNGFVISAERGKNLQYGSLNLK